MLLWSILESFMNLLQQLKHRRLDLGLQQKDMQLRIGMNRQQYQRLEAGGNPRLDTLELIAKGLDAELLLVPNEILRQVRDIIKQGENKQKTTSDSSKLSDDPWKNILD